MDVLARFLHYVSFDTQSDPNCEATPSTEKQKVLGCALAEATAIYGFVIALLLLVL